MFPYFLRDTCGESWLLYVELHILVLAYYHITNIIPYTVVFYGELGNELCYFGNFGRNSKPFTVKTRV